MREWKMLQIIPAQSGWKAIHCQEAENGQVKISSRAIICWALVEPIGAENALQTEVRGVVQESHQLVIVGDLIKTDKREEGVGENQYFLGADQRKYRLIAGLSLSCPSAIVIKRSE